VKNRYAPRRIRHRLATTACVAGLALVASPAAHSEPGGAAPTPPDPGSATATGATHIAYPETDLILSTYNKVQYADYLTASAGGVWFSSPLGLNCGIWDRGRFGCTGDIRGAPPGTTSIGWLNGNIVTRHDPLLAALFPPGRAERDLPPRSYIEYNGTRCATMADSSTYCSRGPFKFFVTPTGTLLSPP
jgi:hypothetical protein